MQGKGTATYPNGDVYEGSFAGGKRDGEGVLRYKGGQEASGQWSKGLLTAPEAASAAAAGNAAAAPADAAAAPAAAGESASPANAEGKSATVPPAGN